MHQSLRPSRSPAHLLLLCIVALLSASSLVAERTTAAATGVVTLNGKAAQRLKVNFWHEQSKTVVWTETDGNGRYRVELGRAGDWVIAIQYWCQQSRFRADEGETQFDWKVEGGTLDVTLDVADDSTGVVVRRPDPDFICLKGVPNATFYTLEAIPFGTFQVTASNQLRTSQPVIVSFTPVNLYERIQIDLKQ